jgi:predicted DNA-binding transcriptional regulator AlpA
MRSGSRARRPGVGPEHGAEGSTGTAIVARGRTDSGLAEPLLVRAPEAARLCGLAGRTWRRSAAAGRVPAPLKLGGAVLWRVVELRAWVAAGTPPRERWEAMRAAQDGRQ